MNIIEISSECSGLAQRGGLGSVIWGISDAFRKAGHRTTIIMPYYAEIHHDVHLYTTVTCFYGGEEFPVSVFETSHFGIRIFLIHNDSFFRGEYADVYIDSGKLHRGYFEDDAKRFAFFSIAACRLLLHLQQDEQIDVIHCHDWHTGLIPLLIKLHPGLYLLSDIYRLFTVHNLEYQGTRPFEAMGNLQGFLDWYTDLAHLERELFSPYLDPHADIPCINPMRAALHSADRVTTVSPAYAKEICLPDSPEKDFLGGRGLEKDFADIFSHGRFGGITNGIDTEYYDPQRLRHPYSHRNRDAGEAQNRLALFHDMHGIIDNMVQSGALIGKTEVALREKLRHIDEQSFLRQPLLVAVTRLTGQKIRLLLESNGGKTLIAHLAATGMHLIFLGKGDLLQQLSSEIATHKNILLFGGFDDELEKRLYAASDCMLMPSEFEPCGTSQMKAMRYGCLPIAAAVGGLIDTIKHDYNGFLYTGHDRTTKAEAFMTCIRRVLDLIKNDKTKFTGLQRNAMLTDFSWNEAAASYLQLMKP
ncbi:MAG: glycogen synthase [Leptospiraceae bacterium]|nr:glycogen synthase [Leptospiraceae bacterium]